VLPKRLAKNLKRNTNINNKHFDELARELQADLDARRERRVFADRRGPKSIEEAYKLQRALRAFRESRGETVIGFKIGYTSAAVRKNNAEIMGLSESVHGYLWDSESYKDGDAINYRRLAIEGELGVQLISTHGDDVSQWEVEFQPIIEIHMFGMDGPAEDNRGRRGLELIGTNCIHAGVVHCPKTKRCLVGEIPLSTPMNLSIGGLKKEQVNLTELEIENLYGPIATISWLLRTLRAEGNGEEKMLKPGSSLICSTPGGLYPVSPGEEVRVEFAGLETICTATPQE
jgi:2-keto-4-pentenoate hydratase